MTDMHPGNAFADDEEFDRFEKALAKCRNCGHIRMSHILKIKKFLKCVDAKLDAAGTYTACSCKNYEPKDNLEYLEFKYNNKEKDK
jgi:ribosomal protein L32